METGSGGRRHIPVLLRETIGGLALKPGDRVLDCTVGAGGHAAAALQATAPDGRLLGLDLDEAALESARTRLSEFGSRAMLVRVSYREAEKAVRDHRFGPVQAALLDLGYSSMEIDDPDRGFSFRFDGPLDMRFDRREGMTAADLIAELTADEMAAVLARYGEERYARRIADGIVKARESAPIRRTLELVDAVARSVPPHYRHGKTHFATRTFQALRIALNDELGTLAAALPEIFRTLSPGGRLAVISFHSLEDRIVKGFFRDLEGKGEAKVLTRRPITAGEKEAGANPRSRSAKLRLAERIGGTADGSA